MLDWLSPALGMSSARPNYEIERTSFPYFSLELVTRGAGTAKLADRTIQLGPGIVFTYGPETHHKINSDPENPLGKYFVDFVGMRSSHLLEACSLSPGSATCIESYADIQTALEMMLSDGARASSDSDAMCVLLLEYVFEKIKVTSRRTERSPGQAHSTFERCCSYMREHSLRLMTLEAVASECGVDKAYLCRLFKRFNRQTPYQYLKKQKMDRGGGDAWG